MSNDIAEELRRSREIKQIVLTGAVPLVDRGQGRSDLRVGGIVAKVAALVMKTLLEEVPRLVAVILRRQETSRLLAELLHAKIVDGHAENRKLLGQQAGLFQVVERRNQLAHGEIAGGAEHHHHARARRFAPVFEIVVHFGNRRKHISASLAVVANSKTSHKRVSSRPAEPRCLRFGVEPTVQLRVYTVRCKVAFRA